MIRTEGYHIFIEDLAGLMKLPGETESWRNAGCYVERLYEAAKTSAPGHYPEAAKEHAD